MKNKVIPLFVMMTKNFFYGVILQMLFITVLFASEGAAQQFKSIKETKMRVQLENATVEQVFHYIESNSSFQFFYDEEVIDPSVRITLNRRSMLLSDVLMEVSREANLKFKQINQVINVNRKSPGMRENQEVIEVIIQTRTVTGRVNSNDDESGLPGVNVLEKGTTNGTVTDIEGRYSLVVKEGAVLVFSSVGYTTEEIAIGDRSVVDLTMTTDVQTLQELVVIGYGERERKDITGAISQISAKEITKQTTMSPEFAMQGRMPGVFVSNPGSNPTARPDIRIRGVTTIGFNDPLYVIDGIPITEGGANNSGGRVGDLRSPINVFALINPNDIESISVLKDASATAIYGVRAANGVVLITTKRGAEGKAKVDVSASYGIQNINKNYDMVNVDDYVMLSREAFANANFTPAALINALFDENNPANLLGSDTYTQDWQDAALVNNAKIQDYNISISGGNSKSNYSVGAGYADQENAVFSNRFTRYSLSINSDHKLNNWLKVGETFRVVYSKQDNESSPNDLGSFVAPWQPLYDNTENGLLGYARTNRTINGTNASRGYGDGTQNNFLALAELNNQRFNLFRNLGSIYAEVSILKDLKVKGTYSIDYYTNNRQNYSDQRSGLFQGTVGIINTDLGNTYGRRQGDNLNLVGEITANYTKSFGNHNLDVIFNVMDQRYFWNNMSQGINRNSTLGSWEQRRIEEGWAPEDKGTFYERNQYGLQGYMARASYNYNSKYYLDATVRRDGSSRFGPGHKWGTFPSVATAWRISDEPFMQNLRFISDLKLRAGWGQIGNQETQDFAFLSVINFNPKAAFGFTDSRIPAGEGGINLATALFNLPTPTLSWEIINTTNFGFDSEFLNSKLRVTAEYYYRFTDGILQNIELPGVVGIVPQPVVNLAQVTNRGVELDVQYNDRLGELNYNVGFNLTTVRNRVVKLFNNNPTGGNQNRIEVGKPISFLWGMKSDGIFQEQADADAYNAEVSHVGAQDVKAPGDVKYIDLGRAPTGEETGQGVWQILEADGLINNFDNTYLGKQIPGYYGGFNIGGDYKGFDLYINFRFTGDVQKVFRQGKESINGGNLNFVSDYLNRWTPDNPSTTTTRPMHQDRSRNNVFHDRFVEDAGFLRFQNFQLGYTLNQQMISRLGISNLRVYLSGMNLFVLTPFGDLDPENNTTPTSFTLGANLSF